MGQGDSMPPLAPYASSGSLSMTTSHMETHVAATPSNFLPVTSRLILCNYLEAPDVLLYYVDYA